jgi:hypothetical protein
MSPHNHFLKKLINFYPSGAYLIRSYRQKYQKYSRLASHQRRKLHGFKVRYNASRKRMVHYGRLHTIWVKRANAVARRANALRRSHNDYVRRLNAAKRACNSKINHLVRAANAIAKRQRRHHAIYVSYRRKAMMYRRRYNSAHRSHVRRFRSRRNAVALYNKYIRLQNFWAKRYNNLRG